MLGLAISYAIRRDPPGKESPLPSLGISMQSTIFGACGTRAKATVRRTLVGATLATLTACNSGPARVTQPYIDSSAAGEGAMQQYDTNGDGVVNGEELEKAPGLKAALPRLDSNGDKGISADEVAA